MAEWLNVENGIVVFCLVFGLFAFYRWFKSPRRAERKAEKQAAHDKKKNRMKRGRPDIKEASSRPNRPNRPSGSKGSRPAGKRPTGSRPAPKKKRPSGSRPAGSRPAPKKKRPRD